MICSDDASHVKGVAYFYISHTKTIPILGLTLALLQQLHMQSTTYATEVEHLESRVSAGDESHISLDVVLRVLLHLAESLKNGPLSTVCHIPAR
jgi:hypothetical protein